MASDMLPIPEGETTGAKETTAVLEQEPPENGATEEDLEVGIPIAKEPEVYAVSKLPKRRPVLQSKRRSVLSGLHRFWMVKLCQALCSLYILFFLLAGFGVFGEDSRLLDPNAVVDEDAGIVIYNGDERAVVTSNAFQRFCLTMARLLAYSMYPVLVLVYLSKCRASMTFLSVTPFVLYMFQDMHELHVYCGKYIAVAGILHSLFHVLRWANQGNMYLLFQNRSGLSGFISFLCVLFIVFPMIYYKKRIMYEIRKAMHYLFFVMAICLAFHSPPSAVPNGGYAPYVMSIVLVYYTLDYLYVYFFMSEKIETTLFHVLPNGVQMTMPISDRFHRRGLQYGGYAYICLPWVSRNQWHAFSLFENPDDPNIVQVFLLSVGDWTKKVHDCLERDTHRPVFIQGPFPSPYSNAASYDNMIMVASGIGVTPALSIIRAHKDDRRTNLIWAVRDASMLEFFLERLYLDHDGWNLIFYTGSAPLNPMVESLNSNVRIIKGRPTLENVIPNIISGIESKTGLPENYLPEHLADIKEELIVRMAELDETDLSSEEKLIMLRDFVTAEGYLFSDLVATLEDRDNAVAGGRRTSVMRAVSASADEFNRRKGISLQLDSAADLGVCEDECPTNEPSPSDLEFSQILDVVRNLRGDSSGSLRSSSKRSSNSSSTLRRRSTQKSSLSSSLRSTPLSSSLTSSARSNQRSRNSMMWSVMKKESSGASLHAAFCPSKENESASAYVKSLDYESVLSTWGILYCGGSKEVEKRLKGISQEYHLGLHTESFAW